MAIVAVAAHLLKQNIGEDYGLRRLSEKHQHDFGSLDQVFWHILTRLSYYRELHVRSQAPLDTAVSLLLKCVRRCDLTSGIFVVRRLTSDAWTGGLRRGSGGQLGLSHYVHPNTCMPHPNPLVSVMNSLLFSSPPPRVRASSCLGACWRAAGRSYRCPRLTVLPRGSMPSWSRI